MKIDNIAKKKKFSKRNHRRFFSSIDMSAVKIGEAIHNAMVKRGDMEDGPCHYVTPCGCGAEGDFIFHRNYRNDEDSVWSGYPREFTGSRHDKEGMQRQWQ